MQNNDIRSHYTTKEVAEMFCVSIDTVRQWRSKRYENSPLRLVGESLDTNMYLYPLSSLEEFVQRNPRFHPLFTKGAKLPIPALPSSLLRRAERILQKEAA